MVELKSDIALMQYNNAKLKNVDTSKLEDDALKKVCDNFEAFFLKQLMDVSLKSTKVAGEGPGSDIIQGMYTDTVSQNSSGSFGISSMLYEYLSQNNKKDN